MCEGTPYFSKVVINCTTHIPSQSHGHSHELSTGARYLWIAKHSISPIALGKPSGPVRFAPRGLSPERTEPLCNEQRTRRANVAVMSQLCRRMVPIVMSDPSAKGIV